MHQFHITLQGDITGSIYADTFEKRHDRIVFLREGYATATYLERFVLKIETRPLCPGSEEMIEAA